MQISWWTLALQALNFLVLVWLLWRFLYKPVREVIDKRKALAEQAFTDANRREQEAEAARRRLEDDRASLARERQDLLRKLHQDLDAERGNVLAAARADADAMIAAATESIASERARALAESRDRIAGLAVDIAAGLLRDIAAAELDGVVLERIEAQLKEMPTDELDRLRKDVAADGARLTVVTAKPIAPADQERWRGRFDACLGSGGKTEFATESGIVGGAELRFPHAALKLTWADQLTKAKELLSGDQAAS